MPGKEEDDRRSDRSRGRDTNIPTVDEKREPPSNHGPLRRAFEGGDAIHAVHEAAGYAARRLLRRTGLLAHRGSHGLPALTTPGADGRIVITLPAPAPTPTSTARDDFPLPAMAPITAASAPSVDVNGESAARDAWTHDDEEDGEDPEQGRDRGQVRESLDWRTRAERAEHAAAWLRSRLRAERARSRSQSALAPIDAKRLATDLAGELARLRTTHPDAVERVVRRVLAAHGLPTQAPRGSGQERGGAGRVAARDGRGGTSAATTAMAMTASGWSRDGLAAVAAQALARTPEIADAAYVDRVLALVARAGRATLPALLQSSGLDSAMARRRLRLTVETMVALGPLLVQNGVYTLNTHYQPPVRQARAGRGASQGQRRT